MAKEILAPSGFTWPDGSAPMGARIRWPTFREGFSPERLETLRLLDLFGRWGIKTS